MYLYHVSFIIPNGNNPEVRSNFITSTGELSTITDVRNFQKKVDELAQSENTVILCISLVSSSFKE